MRNACCLFLHFQFYFNAYRRETGDSYFRLYESHRMDYDYIFDISNS